MLINSDDEEDADYLYEDDDTPMFQQDRDLEAKFKAQKLIDDQKIAVVYEALSKGVELQGNKLYY